MTNCSAHALALPRESGNDQSGAESCFDLEDANRMPGMNPQRDSGDNSQDSEAEDHRHAEGRPA